MNRLVPPGPFRLLLTGIGLVVLLLLGWQLADDLLLLFAAALFAAAASRGAEALAGATPLSRGWALVLVLLGAVVLVAAFLWFAGLRFTSQLEVLTERIPAGLDRVRDSLTANPVLQPLTAEIESLIAQFREGEGAAGSSLLTAFRVTTGTLFALVAWAVLVVFLAADLHRYSGAIVRLVPPRGREATQDLFEHLGGALTWWLLGRLVSMTLVGILTMVGLFLLGIPLAFALGLIAGLFSFVPFLGPLAATAPAVLVALGQGPTTALQVLGLYALVQFLESYLITPQVQKRMVSVPPVVLIAAQIGMGTLLGIGGVMFATPLALTVVVGIQVLYLKRTLGEPVHVWGER
ncbi:MAG: AI-2E family transporter [Gemmatimonadota bacterium]|nr:AI-2E family transporter [Gemmatimonadota bacterium]